MTLVVTGPPGFEISNLTAVPIVNVLSTRRNSAQLLIGAPSTDSRRSPVWSPARAHTLFGSVTNNRSWLSLSGSHAVMR